MTTTIVPSPEERGIVKAYLTADAMVARANLIQEVKERVMKNGVHYGLVPGCGEKPTLLKPGAEKILSVFKIGADFEVEDLSTEDSIRYRVKAKGFHQETGMALGYGLGEASTGEEKWKWRRAYDEEFKETPADRKRTKRTSKGPLTQVRTNPADLANTVLKMAKKRAMVDLALTVTGSSDFFEQDVEEMDPDLVASTLNEAPIQPAKPKGKSKAEAAPKQEPTPKPADGPKIDPRDAALFIAMIRERKMLKAAVMAMLKPYGVQAVEDLRVGDIDAFEAAVKAIQVPEAEEMA